MLSEDSATLPYAERPLLVVGDLILDQFIRGTVKRISPEAPVPVVEQQEATFYPGGAANVACNLAALGAAVVLVGAIGDDEEGRQLMRSLSQSKIDTSLIQVIPGRPTSLKTRIIAEQQQIVRVDREVTTPLGEQDVSRVLEAIQGCLAGSAGLVFSDYNKGFLSPSIVTAIIRQAQSLEKTVIADTKLQVLDHYRGVTALTPNINELQLSTGRLLCSPSDIDVAARELMDKIQAPVLLVTCGQNGIRLYDSDSQQRTHFPGHAETVADVSGAGDTVIAVFTWALTIRRFSVHQAAKLANDAGTLAVGKKGISTINVDELLSLVEVHSINGLDRELGPSKNRTLEQLLSDIHAVRQSQPSAKIVFTNGCFDMLHAGHVSYLQRAKALGDLLLVGLNSDSSVRQIKGNRRPIVPEAQRVQTLAGLECVDFVVLFDQETPLHLIQAIKPDFLVKGSDYELHQVVGRDFVEANGGRVELLPSNQGISTSKIIQEIMNRYSE
ncbi:ADP-heptose [Aspergillus oryzae 100-8]|uniref:D-glycero-beta-D-manno-heptose 1-phosphate adenylyltransferase n=1 Tax=Aspergillus oryzae (strain 3.042) TaxID=1160506 RepID=I8IAC5_ASPO3|nr:ADP-heptose synthase, bifunctional sugar kinase/adenylyltransferase [Aspergillus oryzae 3.042]KDE75904.1 ADP-heptose [Aspergillus oryzae 100-8]|eukprot:EIT74291.1 ADP-heptose synthase, bifunctional sugar kinase/adenylyltransferase [Aspergillus oryzae 3.042]